MDLVRFGLVIRALRRRKGWRQVDLAGAADVSQGTVSLIERGHSGRLSLETLMRVAGALDARISLDVRWRAGELDRILDQGHAALAAAVTQLLESAGWSVRVEVTYAVYGERGSIDVLAWHEEAQALLVIEVKTEVTSAEATIRKLDEKVRLAAGFAFERFGWRAGTVSRMLVVEDTSTARDRVAAGAALFAAAFPARTVAIRRWIRSPAGPVSGLLFFRDTNRHRGTRSPRGRHRVKPRRAGAGHPNPNVAPRPSVSDDIRAPRTILTNRAYHDPGS
ncbi:MAG TPA: helix-turn-helix domain-containing protein [Candidatus Limnocylindrales bacterium]|nr:helix-turn-helix domain-containing protein [Candidatus Limnocylindrales bacterium]